MDSLIESLPVGVFVMMVGFLFAATGVIVFAGLHARRRARLMKTMPTSNIGMASDGYVEFEGRAEAIDGQTVTSPLTQRPCVWYHAEVERFAGSGASKGGDRWSTIKERSSTTPFLIRDATGVCAVFRPAPM